MCTCQGFPNPSMSELLHEFILRQAKTLPSNPAIVHKDTSLSYASLARGLETVAQGLLRLGLSPSERVAVFLSKQPETVIGMFGTTLAGGVFVPVNPLLKAEQVAHIF